MKGRKEGRKNVDSRHPSGVKYFKSASSSLGPDALVDGGTKDLAAAFVTGAIKVGHIGRHLSKPSFFKSCRPCLFSYTNKHYFFFFRPRTINRNPHRNRRNLSKRFSLQSKSTSTADAGNTRSQWGWKPSPCPTSSRWSSSCHSSALVPKTLISEYFRDFSSLQPSCLQWFCQHIQSGIISSHLQLYSSNNLKKKKKDQKNKDLGQEVIETRLHPR